MIDEDKIFNVMADPTRRLILEELAERAEQSQYELMTRLIMKHQVGMSTQAIVKHIATLEDSGLVRSVKRGKYRYLSFNRAPLHEVLARWTRQ